MRMGHSTAMSFQFRPSGGGALGLYLVLCCHTPWAEVSMPRSKMSACAARWRIMTRSWSCFSVSSVSSTSASNAVRVPVSQAEILTAMIIYLPFTITTVTTVIIIIIFALLLLLLSLLSLLLLSPTNYPQLLILTLPFSSVFARQEPVSPSEVRCSSLPATPTPTMGRSTTMCSVAFFQRY